MYERIVGEEKYDYTRKNLVTMYAKIICRQPDVALIKANLERMIRPLAVSLLALCKAPEINETILLQTKRKAKLLSNIFKSVEELSEKNENNPLIPIYAELSPLLMQLIKKFEKFEKIVEQVTSIIKKSMRSLDKYFLPYLGVFATQIVASYKNTGLHTYLYCAEIITTVYGSMPDFQQILGELFILMAKHSFEILRGTGAANNPHIVDDFFGMCSRYIRKCPQLIFNSETIADLIKFAVSIIGFEHVNAAKTLYLFLYNLFAHFAGKKTNDTKLDIHESETLSILISHGPIIMKKLFIVLVSAPHKEVYSYVNELIIEINMTLPKASEEWLIEAAQILPADCMTKDEKAGFKDIVKRNDPRILMDKLQELYRRGVNSAKRNRAI